jgi:hypothetical protein
LPVVSALNATDVFEVVNGGVSRQLSFTTLLAWSGLTGMVDGRIAIAVAAGITPGGAAGGDLAGTYPNPVLVTIGGLVPGAYGGGAAIPVVTVDAKGRIIGITTTPVTTSLTGAVRYDAAQALSGGEQATGRGNINAQVNSTRLNAVVGIAGVMLNSLVVWDDDSTAHKIDITGYMEAFLAAVDADAARGVLGVEKAGFSSTIRIDDTVSPYAVLAGNEVIIVDASANPVTVDLPAIDATQDGRCITVKARDATNAITINCDAADDIDGAASIALNVTYASWTLVASFDAGGSFWSVV